MPKKIIATPEAVSAAYEKLVSEGLEPTLERVRTKLGGGSYTTISRMLAEITNVEDAGGDQASEIPADLIEIGRKTVVTIYTSVHRQARATLEAVEADARRKVELAQTARAEAALEIERLERELESQLEQLELAVSNSKQERSRCERIEARSESQQTEISRLGSELSAARADLDAARTQVREAEAMARDAAQVANMQSQTLRLALAKAEARLEAVPPPS